MVDHCDTASCAIETGCECVCPDCFSSRLLMGLDWILACREADDYYAKHPERAAQVAENFQKWWDKYK